MYYSGMWGWSRWNPCWGDLGAYIGIPIVNTCQFTKFLIKSRIFEKSKIRSKNSKNYHYSWVSQKDSSSGPIGQKLWTGEGGDLKCSVLILLIPRFPPEERVSIGIPIQIAPQQEIWGREQNISSRRLRQVITRALLVRWSCPFGKLISMDNFWEFSGRFSSFWKFAISSMILCTSRIYHGISICISQVTSAHIIFRSTPHPTVVDLLERPVGTRPNGISDLWLP